MSILVDSTKRRIAEFEARLETLTADENPKAINHSEIIAGVVSRIASEKNRLRIYESSDLDKVVNDMKIIRDHVQAVETKYECRSVKFMYRFAGFVNRHISKSLSEKILNYTVTEIHAPVCSIIAGSKPELQPMPEYYAADPAERDLVAWHASQATEMKKFQNISHNYYTKPATFYERTRIKARKIFSKLSFRE